MRVTWISFWRYFCVVCVVAVVCIATIQSRALAVTEYCPADIAQVRDFSAPNGSIHAMLLSADSERTVSGHVIVQTSKGWFTFPFGPTKISLDRVIYENDYFRFAREEFMSPVLYFRVPDGSTLENYWVSDAVATGDALLNWDARGVVQCGPTYEGRLAHAHDKPQVRNFRKNLAPYDLSVLPGPDEHVEVAALTSSPLPAGCSVVFELPKTLSIDKAKWPDVETIGVRSVLVSVAVDAQGAVAEAWVEWPSGYDLLDKEALRVARTARFAPPLALCQSTALVSTIKVTFQ